MSTAEQTDERTIFVRSYELDLVEGDGRTIDATLVPYNVPATVADAPDFRTYQEMFLPGSFREQAKPGASRVLMNFEHEQGIGGLIGKAVSLQETDAELQGTFRMLDSQDSDKALELVRDGILTGLSIEFRALRTRTVDGVVQRVRAHLDKVSLCRTPAYAAAQVLAVREAVEIEVPDVLPPNFERLEALGILPRFERAVVTKPWNGDPARFTDEEYQRSCLIDRGGDAPVKERCSLPVLEPNGDLNANALGPAAGALRGARGGLMDVSAEMKAMAARKLVRFYRQAGMEPPAGIMMMSS